MDAINRFPFHHFLMRMLLFLGLSCGVGVLVWKAIAYVLASDYGLDLTDEGLYLLSADPPHKNASWGFFDFGRHTAPLFWVVGYDISSFRTLGGVLLFVAGGALGWISIKAIQSSKSGREIGPNLVGLAVGAVASLLYYAALVRTPSYNWANLFGLMVASFGIVGLAARNQDAGRESVPSWRDCMFLFVAASGLVFTLPAKPSTLFLAFVACFPLLITARGVKCGLLLLIGIVCLCGVVATAALVSGFWDREFLLSMYRGFSSDQPKISDHYGVMYAVKTFLKVPWIFIWDIGVSINRSPAFLVLLCVGVGALILACFTPRRQFVLQSIGLLLLVVGSLVNSQALPFQAPADRWIYHSLVTSSLVVVLACFFIFVSRAARQSMPWRRVLKVLSISGYLTAMPFVFGFGSAHGAYAQAFLAAGLFPIVALVLAYAASHDTKERAYYSVLIMSLAVVITAVTLRDSWKFPYRIKPVSENTVETVIGRRNCSLKIDPELASALSIFRTAADNHGWKPGDPLLGLVWRWSATLTYALGGLAPDSLMLTIWGYDKSAELASFNIEHRLGGYPAKMAWLLIDDLTTAKVDSWSSRADYRGLDDDAEVDTSLVLSEWCKMASRKFPDDYEFVASWRTTQLWKPKQ